MSKFKERAKDFAAAGLNKLPDNANLFLRYMTGLGGRNLDLDDSTISNIREASKEADMYTTRFDRDFIDEMGERRTFSPVSSFTFASENPRTGAVNPYGSGNKDVIQTLGRFQSTVNPDGKTFNIKDTYDMKNKFEDPDLVSGKIQPIKALQEFSKALGGVGRKAEYGFTMSPKTSVARGLLYGLPIKPKEFGIDINIPMPGNINNREIYK